MKIVKELLYEDFRHFIEDSDPIHDMGIGAKPAIIKWLKKYNVKNYKISKRIFNINVFDSVSLNDSNLYELPIYINFNHIMGGFHIKNNSLFSLRGCPYSISGSFIASNNNLINLKDGPFKVHDSYAVSNNKLESLEGISKKIGKSIYLNNNNLKNLQYIPSYINGDFYIYDNPIETLKYFPSEITGNLKFTPSEFLTKEKIKSRCKVWGHIIEQ